MAKRIVSRLSPDAGSLSSVVLVNQPVRDVGIASNYRAGRVLTAADFTALGLSAPVALYNLSNVNDSSGNARTLTNKGTVAFTTGITGAAGEAALFTGSTAQALYISDTGAADPFRISYGSWGCWFKTAKQATDQRLIWKGTGAGSPIFGLRVTTTNNVSIEYSALAEVTLTGVSNVCDGRWHHAVAAWDGNTISLYVDGVLEASASGQTTGPLLVTAAMLNIGAGGADGTTAATSPCFGSIDEAFVTSDVLSAEQVRNLYCLKIAHGAPATPDEAVVSVRRRRRGGAFLTTDFPASPRRLYNFTGGALTDAGLDGATLTNNGTALAAPGADGALGNAFNLVKASSQSLSATDTGLPSGTSPMSLGCWFKTSTVSDAAYGAGLVGYGNFGGGFGAQLMVQNSTEYVQFRDGVNNVTSSFKANDGQWHFAVVVVENAPADGQKQKLYIDGRFVAGGTANVSVALVGAGGFVIGKRSDVGAPTANFNGQIDGVFVTDAALTAEQVRSLYALGSQALPQSAVPAGEVVEGFDATYVYAAFDSVAATCDAVDMKVRVL